MSKIYNLYLKKKLEDNKKYYLFKSGSFYIFIDEDAKKVSELTCLKLSHLTTEVVKCGIPLNSLDKYLVIFKNLGLDVEVVNDLYSNKECINKVLDILDNIDINNITPMDAFNIIKKLRGYLNYD